MDSTKIDPYTIDLTGSSWSGTDTISSITISPLDMSSLTNQTLSITGAVGGTGTTIGHGTIGPSWTTASPNTNAMWTTNTTGMNWASGSNNTTLDQGGKITLKGDNADIDINGKSLKQTLELLEERLNWLVPNPEMEKEWDDLRKLGERYRKLEKKCKEKSEMWSKLKSMPKPDIT